jgi:coenzyme F420-0:L-glutamate ligase / coenzyme F420-1:gamma-L-glutamate ligase
MAIPEIQIFGLDGIPEVNEGDDLVDLLSTSLASSGVELLDHDVVVITQKIVSKAEGRLVDLSTIEPSAIAKTFADEWGKDARHVEVVLRESARIVRMDRGVMITETHHGFICANSGVDASNVPETGLVCLLPVDSDASARRIRAGIQERLGVSPAIIISDSFGRPWRRGITNIAIGIAGMEVFADYRGQIDSGGHELRVTIMAVPDELASAAELVHGKLDGRPVAIIRGYPYVEGDGRATDLVLEREKDLFP